MDVQLLFGGVLLPGFVQYSILGQFPSSFFSIGFFGVHAVHPYRSIGTTTTWKKSCYIYIYIYI